MKKGFIFISIIMILFSCKKNDLPEGNYVGVFNGYYLVQNVQYQKYRSHYIKIRDSGKNTIVFDSDGFVSDLIKNESNVTGTFNTGKYVGTGHYEDDGPITSML